MADANDRPCCLQCGKETKFFISSGRIKMFCGEPCRDEFRKRPEQTAKCRGCESEFIKKYERHIYCSAGCKSRFGSKNRKRGPFTCKQCGKSYHTNRPKGEGETFCSRECSFDYYRKAPPHSKVYFRDCRTCSKPFASRRPRSSCSRECELEYARAKTFEENKAKKVLLERSCKECGASFISEYGTKRREFCSDICLHRRSRRIAKATRKARIRGVREYERIDPIAVFNRDKWRCRICGKKTPFKKRGTLDHDAPELDHILPLVAGGNHTWDNVQCACRKCNGDKGGKPLGQILMLGKVR